MIDWNPLTKQLQYVLSLKPTAMMRLYENVCFYYIRDICIDLILF